MKHLTKHLEFNIPARMGFLNITNTVEDLVRESGVREGICLVNAMHITASVFINDDESGLHEDYKKWLEKLAPFDPSSEKYRHNRTGEDNGSVPERPLLPKFIKTGDFKNTHVFEYTPFFKIPVFQL